MKEMRVLHEFSLKNIVFFPPFFPKETTEHFINLS